MWLKKLLYPLGIILLKLWFGFKVFGKSNIPQKKPVIIASNHMSNIDPIAIGAAIPQEIKYMAKEELFRIPGFRWLITFLGAFPVDKKHLKKSLKNCFEVLKNRKILVLFPEGTRSKTGKLLNGQLGIGMIAYKSKADIIPTCIIGTNKVLPVKGLFPRPAQIEVKFGKPIKAKEFCGYKEGRSTYKIIVDKIMKEIRNLQQPK